MPLAVLKIILPDTRMKIKDIVNRDIVNLTNCEQEPIHIPGSIQPHGFLLAMDADSHVIDYCTGNIKEFIGITHEQCLGKDLSEILGNEVKKQLLVYVQKQVDAVNPPLELNINGNNLLCSMHRSGKMYVAEFEPTDPNAPDLSTVYNQTIQFV